MPVLLAREISTYVSKYGLLIATNYEKEKLKGASYSMTADPTYKAWRFNENREKVTLEIEKDENDKAYYEVPENSLVYIRLLQKLRLPYYIIGRFNLKVTYTYKGLLLGTGPQVDPGYEQQLNIPLHNFTKEPVKIYLHKSFVSIDFVRTTPLQLDQGVPESRAEFLNDEKWEKFRDKLCPQNFIKLRRNEIEDYVGKDRPTSTLGKLVTDFEKAKKGADQIVKTVDTSQKDTNETLKMIESRRRLDSVAFAIMLATFLIGWFAIYYFAVNLSYKLEERVKSKMEVVHRELKGRSDMEVRLKKLEEDFQGVIDNQTSVKIGDIQAQLKVFHNKTENTMKTLSAFRKRIEELERKDSSHLPKRRDKKN